MNNNANPTNTIKLKPEDLGFDPGTAPQHVQQSTVTNALMTVYFIAGMVAVLMIIIGGIRYVTANGDSNQIQAAKNQVTYAVVGLIVIIMAAAITQFVIANITK